MATEKIVDQLKAIKTAWPVFAFVGTIFFNHLKTQNDFENKVRETNSAFEKEIVVLKDMAAEHWRNIDRIDNRVDKVEEDLEKHYKRKKDVD